eukprot:1159873-Pelagomonas_calceolata.AAC.8
MARTTQAGQRHVFSSCLQRSLLSVDGRFESVRFYHSHNRILGLSATTGVALKGAIFSLTTCFPEWEMIQKQLIRPEKLKQHIQGDVLKFVSTLNSQTNICVNKVESHAGIAGDE